MNLPAGQPTVEIERVDSPAGFSLGVGVRYICVVKNHKDRAAVLEIASEMLHEALLTRPVEGGEQKSLVERLAEVGCQSITVTLI